MNASGRADETDRCRRPGTAVPLPRQVRAGAARRRMWAQQADPAAGLVEPCAMFRTRLSGGGGLPNYRGVLLRHVVELTHAELAPAQAQACSEEGEMSAIIRWTLTARALQGSPRGPLGLADQACAGLHRRGGAGDQGAGLLGCVGAALGQATDLCRHHGVKPRPLPPPARAASGPRALSARRLVWKAMPSVTEMISPMRLGGRLDVGHGR